MSNDPTREENLTQCCWTRLASLWRRCQHRASENRCPLQHRHFPLEVRPWDTCSYACKLPHRALTAAPTVTTHDKNQPVRPSTQQGPAANVEKVRGAPYKTLLQLFTGKAGCGHAQLSRHRGLGGAVIWRERGLHTGQLHKV